MSIAELIVPSLHHARAAERGRRQHGPAVIGTASWAAWGTTASVTVTDDTALPAARRLVARQLAAAEKAAAAARPDAEVHRLYRAGGRPITVSPLLAELVAAALVAAERTGGDVDPTVAAAMTAVHGGPGGRRGRPVGSGERTAPRPAAGWQRVDLEGRRLQVPAGTTLDLSATATAAACDRAAAKVRERLGVGVLVTLGGDAATAGPAPAGGWSVAVDDRGGDRPAVVRLPAGTALSTSHFDARPTRFPAAADRPAGRPVGHLIDPYTGLAPRAVWRMASAIGFSSLEAATYTAAALVRGAPARAWLTQLWVPARLVTVHDDVVTAGPWGAHEPSTGPLDDPARPTTPVPAQRLANPRRTTR